MRLWSQTRSRARYLFSIRTENINHGKVVHVAVGLTEYREIEEAVDKQHDDVDVDSFQGIPGVKTEENNS